MWMGSVSCSNRQHTLVTRVYFYFGLPLNLVLNPPPRAKLSINRASAASRSKVTFSWTWQKFHSATNESRKAARALVLARQLGWVNMETVRAKLLFSTFTNAGFFRSDSFSAPQASI